VLNPVSGQSSGGGGTASSVRASQEAMMDSASRKNLLDVQAGMRARPASQPRLYLRAIIVASLARSLARRAAVRVTAVEHPS